MRVSRFSPVSALLAVSFAAALPVAADSGSLGAHTHGEASMQVAVESQRIDVLFRSPAANLVGFEHEPRNEDQKAQLDDVVEWLGTTPLVNNLAGDCLVVDAVVHTQRDSGRKRHDDDDHSHDDDHHHHAAADSHSEFDVSQQLRCESDALQGLTTELQDRYPAIERLIVDWVTDNRQGQLRLTGNSRTISLDR